MKIFHYKKTLIFLGTIIVAFWLLSLEINPHKKEDFTYGVSFSRLHADELKLDWEETYLAILDDLGVRNFRFSAHWPTTEPEKGKFNFSELDFQFREAEKRNASVILAVGHRLPGWPECHTPKWLDELSHEQHLQELMKYVEAVVNRYKDSPALKYWQIENEVFLKFFSRASCGIHSERAEEILEKEIALVRKLDPVHPLIVTDSGEFGSWTKAYDAGDVFGTSMYLYVWSHQFGPIRYPITSGFFRIKHSLVRLMFGAKPAIVIELSTEPWLLQPIVDTPMDILLDRMGPDKFNEMIDVSSKTGFDTFYLWGAEWWYWMKLHGHPELWERAQQIYK